MQIQKTPLREWSMSHVPSKELFCKDGYWYQIMFVRDVIPRVLANSYEERLKIRDDITVISEHVSKSVRLPVFQITLDDGTTFTIRSNFYDWKISVNSPRDVEADFMGLFDPTVKINSRYCEGFPEELVYGPYKENMRQFTIELPPDLYQVFTFFWIFAHKVLGNEMK